MLMWFPMNSPLYDITEPSNRMKNELQNVAYKKKSVDLIV